MNISQCWQPTDDKYVETAKYIAMCTYHCALDNLQQLVVQWLFELHKLNLSQTAYHAHTHIAKSLQARCNAIWHAVKAYNTARLTIDPPHLTLDWSKTSHYSFLDEFTLLQDTQNNVHDRP
ncbi:uncharacterized protein LAESUDRAFT_663337 [Laetiporus sulphureus 93-53]|uniref:Uncharacterized protein n=1 Tax=Laetiporus sulphureus 93-53 TaxID=1314785 RepID=A0A165BV88_9APHY|nr:uncharacterized protein LAESUDRAFT_663337 [Laetiporus sulphureus 93-53]KZT01717.1 hypothetical protein LAESUDRAFT_663337 [Laetiporus sulphureus 93-53]